MVDPLVAAPAAVYAGIGVVGLARPAMVPAMFGGTAHTPAARTEVRTVYGGLSLAFAGALGAVASRRGAGRDGVVGALAAASAGMAAGRLAGSLVEGELRPWPTGAFLVLEAALAGSLAAALR